MKTIHNLIICLLCYPNFVFADESALPAEIRLLQERRNEEITKINNVYSKALEKHRDRITKAGDLKSANLVQKLIDELSNKENTPLQPPSVQELLTSSKWKVRGFGPEYEVSFQDDGIAIRDDTKEKLWKWNMDGKILWCHWFSSGWIRFEVPDDPKSDKWSGKSKGGESVTLQRLSAK
jgi:hypothetical protein